jgi:hypothetical protein
MFQHPVHPPLLNTRSKVSKATNLSPRQSRHKHESFADISNARSICTNATKTQQLGILMNHESYSSKIFFIFPMYIWGAKQH